MITGEVANIDWAVQQGKTQRDRGLKNERREREKKIERERSRERERERVRQAGRPRLAQ